MARLLITVVCATGCSGEPRQPLRVGLVVWPPFELGFLAAAHDTTFREQVELVDYWSPAVAVRDFRNGSLDVVAVTINYALDLAARSDDTRVVLVVDMSRGGDAVIARGDIAGMSDLRGQRVGVEASALGAYVLARALDHHGMAPADVEIVPVDLDRQEDLFLQGELAAVTTYDPVRTRLLRAGGREVFSSAAMDGEIIDVLVTNTRVMAELGPQLQLLVDQWLAAGVRYRQDPVAASEVMARRQALAPEEFPAVLADGAVMYSLEDNVRLLDGDPPALRASLDVVQRASARAGLLPREVDLDLLLEPRYVLASPATGGEAP